MTGIDISKDMARRAAKKVRQAEIAVASAYHLPLADGTVDLLLDCFSPLAVDEFRRVLRPGGHFLYVVPAAEHLWELKEAIYDEPYENREDKHALPGFRQAGREKLTYRVHLDSPELIQALFSMTPYIHRTGRDSMERLRALRQIDLTLSFLLLTFAPI